MATVALKNGVVVKDDSGRYHTLYAGSPVPENADKDTVKRLTNDGFLGAENLESEAPAAKPAEKRPAK